MTAPATLADRLAQRRSAKAAPPWLPGIHPGEAKRVIGWLVVLLIVTGLAFSTALPNQFTNWDDQAYVSENLMLRAGTWDAFVQLWTRFYLGNYHPLTLVTYWLEYRFFRLWPAPYIFNNIVIHLGNVVLAFVFCQILLKRWKVALFAAALFALHPTRVESVVWISERKDVLYTFFFFASLILYIRFTQTGYRRYYALSFLALSLSLLSKAMAMTLPVILILLDLLERKPITFRSLIEKAPFFALSFCFGVLALYAQKSQGAVAAKPLENLLIPLLYANRGLLCYAYMLVFPFQLSSLYPSPYVTSVNLGLEFYLAPIWVLFLVGIGIWQLRGHQFAWFAGAFFLFTIGPVLQLVPVGLAIAADRYTYVPALGFFMLVALLSADLIKARIGMKFSATLAVGLILGYAGASASRSTVWFSSETLWTDVVSKFPKAAISYSNRAQFYMVNNRYEEAMADVNKAIQVDPSWKWSYQNRSILRKSRGDYEGALADVNISLTLDPNSLISLNNRAVIYIETLQFDLALADLNRLIEMVPDYTEPYRNRAFALEQLGRFQEARNDLELVQRIDPDGPDAWYSMGAVSDRAGRHEEAIKFLTRAIELRPNVEDFLTYRGTVYITLKKANEAEADFQRAIELEPGKAEAWSNLATSHRLQGRLEESLTGYEKALSLTPGRAEFEFNRAAVLQDLNRDEEALEALNRGLAKADGFAQAWLMKATTCLKLKRLDEAVEALDRTLLLEPDLVEARNYRAAVKAELKRFDEAWEDVRYLQGKGLQVQERFLKQLKEASGRQE